MKRTFGMLIATSFFAVATAAFGLASTTQSAPESPSASQVKAWIASAKTPADHLRIARFYQANAQEDLAQAQEHESMLAAYKANPTQVNEKSRRSTADHCEYFVQHLKSQAAENQKLAQLHEQMANKAQ